MKIFAPVPSFLCLVAGLGSVFVGMLMHGFLKGIIMSVIRQKLALNRDSETLPIWRDVPIDIYTRFYIFNYTNADDYMENWQSGVKPKVEQVGPYTYRQYRQKTVLKWYDNDDDDSLEYIETKRYHFIPEMSVGSEKDVVTIPNIPLMAIIHLAPESEKGALKAAIEMTNTTPFVEHTVGDFLFHGYKDELVDLIQYLTGQEILPGAIFGILYGRNGSDDGIIKMKRGNNDNMEIGQITHWNNASTLKNWNGMPCNKIRGTDGTLHHANIQKDETLVLFNLDLSRSLYVRYMHESSFRGIPAYRFTVDLSLLADVNMNPDNRCYCMGDIEKCNDAGVMSLGPVKEGAPVFMSFPHFLMANYKTRFAIDGLNPNPDLHQLFLDIEPVSGAPMKVVARLQMNVKMESRKGVEDVEDWPDVLLPILWIDEGGELTEELSDMISWKMGMAMMAGAVLPWVAMGFGLALLGLGSCLTLLLLLKMKTSRVLPLMVSEDPYVKPTSRGYFGNGYAH